MLPQRPIGLLKLSDEARIKGTVKVDSSNGV